MPSRSSRGVTADQRIFLVAVALPLMLMMTACVPGCGLAASPARDLLGGMSAADPMALAQALNLGNAEAPA